MLVSHSHRFIYLKTHKAAGSSIYRMLERFCAPPAFLESPAYHTSALHLSPYGMVARLVDDLVSTYRPHRVQDHSGLACARDLFPAEFWRYHKIAAVRHPYPKIVSAFFYRLWNLRQKNPNLPRAEDLSRADLTERFSNYVMPEPEISTGRNDREYFFCEGQFMVDSVIRYEHLHDDLEALSERLNLGLDVRKELPHEKRRSEDRAGLRYQDFITPDAKAAIDAHYGWYFERFGYAPVFPDASAPSGAPAAS